MSTDRYLMTPDHVNHRIHKVVDEETGQERFVLSLYEVWRPGSFESKGAAQRAINSGLGDKTLQKLQDTANAEDGPRVITLSAVTDEANSWYY